MAIELKLKLKEGDKAPNFSALTNGGDEISLADFKGKAVILYFYPRDDTPGCTKEACGFRDHFEAFTKKGAVVLGVSVDPVKTHDKFVAKFKLPFPLLADAKGELARRYGSLRDLGVIKFARRNTFLIDPQGRVAKVYLSANTSRNSQEVIDDLKKLTVLHASNNP